LNNPDPTINKDMGNYAHKRGGARERFYGSRPVEEQATAQERTQRTALVRRLIAALEKSND
jgi:hypothetical protein